MQEQQINNYINPDSGNTFKIDTRKLQSEFQCTICLNLIEDCYITRCGHVYCKKCIQQTVGRHHRCPNCNQPLNGFENDVFKNYHFNTIKKIVHEEKRQQATKYLNKAFNEVEEKENEQRDKLMKPIQEKISEIFKDTLLRYRDSLINLFEIEKKVQEKKVMLGQKNIRDNDEIIKQLHVHLLNNFPQPIISPDLLELSTTLHVLLPGNKWHKSKVKLSPISTLETLLPTLENICSENNIMLKGKIEEQLVVNGLKVPVKQRLGMLAGKKIEISGGLPFQVKIYCYTHNWNKGKVSDFYICQKCNVKWICQSCVLYCHEGHQSKIQLKNNTPDWAICYCVSKCDCKALNKNNS